MSPVQYVEQTRAFFGAQGFPPYEWTVNGAPPLTPLTKRLAECRVAMFSMGGIYIKDSQPPFNPEKNDLTIREIPRDIDVARLAISHDYYDHSNADRDINCVFPVERMRELEAEGYIGELAPMCYTAMGRIFRRTALMGEMAPDILRRLEEGGVDVFLLVPA